MNRQTKTPRRSSGVFEPGYERFIISKKVVISFGHRQFGNEEFIASISPIGWMILRRIHFLQLFLIGEQLFFTGTGTVCSR